MRRFVVGLLVAGVLMVVADVTRRVWPPDDFVAFGTFIVVALTLLVLTWYRINLIFMDMNIAERVAKAVAHAATLCAKEPF